MLPGGVGGVPGSSGISYRGGVRSGVVCLRQLHGGAPVPLRLQLIKGIFTVPFRQGMYLSSWFCWSITRCLSIAAFTISYGANLTSRLFSSQTSAHSFLLWYCVFSIVARENPPLAILAVFNARRMSDYSIFTPPPCLAIVADMLKTYKKLVAACNNEVWLVH
jgi:hypothetical protein